MLMWRRGREKSQDIKENREESWLQLELTVKSCLEGR